MERGTGEENKDRDQRGSMGMTAVAACGGKGWRQRQQQWQRQGGSFRFLWKPNSGVFWLVDKVGMGETGWEAFLSIQKLNVPRN